MNESGTKLNVRPAPQNLFRNLTESMLADFGKHIGSLASVYRSRFVTISEREWSFFFQNLLATFGLVETVFPEAAQQGICKIGAGIGSVVAGDILRLVPDGSRVKG